MIVLENVHGMTESGAKRFLIDRKWPRGVVRCIPRREKSGLSRRALAPIVWRPALAPGLRLARWFHEHRETGQFRRMYFAELQKREKEWMPIAREAESGITLLYRDDGISLATAEAFKEFLEHRLQEGLSEPVRGGLRIPARKGVSTAPPVEKAASRKRRLPLKPEKGFGVSEKRRFVPFDTKRL